MNTQKNKNIATICYPITISPDESQQTLSPWIAIISRNAYQLMHFSKFIYSTISNLYKLMVP